MSVIPRHKVFISYHHARDQSWKDEFVVTYGQAAEAFVDRSVWPGDIDDHLPTETIAQAIRDGFIRDATVTIVLVGQETWKRKHVDWEIYSSLRNTRRNPRNGLLGILLPDVRFPRSAPVKAVPTSPPRKGYLPYLVPPRLWDNIVCGYAVMRPWPQNALELQAWIHEAFKRRAHDPPPDLSRRRFARNRTGDRWYD